MRTTTTTATTTATTTTMMAATKKLFDPEEDIPDLSGKVIFITGGTSPHARECALALAKHNPSHIYLTGPSHSPDAGRLLALEIEHLSSSSSSSSSSSIPSSSSPSSPQSPPLSPYPSSSSSSSRSSITRTGGGGGGGGTLATYIPNDPASLTSTALAVHQFTSACARLDILICNGNGNGNGGGGGGGGGDISAASSPAPSRSFGSVAGMGMWPGLVTGRETGVEKAAGLTQQQQQQQQTGVTKDGYEVQFGVNHVAHALLVKLLLPVMVKTAKEDVESDVRIILNTSPSLSSSSPASSWLGGGRGLLLGNCMLRRGRSELAGVLYAQELSRRFPHITTVAVHPGGGGGGGAYTARGGFSLSCCLDRALGRTIPVPTTTTTTTATTAAKTEDSHDGARDLLRPAPAAAAEKEAENNVVRTALWAATAGEGEEQVVSGEVYEGIGVVGSRRSGLWEGCGGGEKLARQLWEWTQKELEVYEV